VHTFQRGVHEITLTVSSAFGKPQKSLLLVALNETTFVLQTKTPFKPIVGSQEKHVISLTINNEKKLEAELICNEDSTLFVTKQQKLFYEISNSSLVRNFNHSCQLAILGENEIYFEDILIYRDYLNFENLDIAKKSEVKTNETFYSYLDILPDLSLTSTNATWTILNVKKNTKCNINYGSKQTFVINEPGLYVVKATVSNPVAETDVTVQDPISGWTVKPTKPTIFTQPNRQISFISRFKTGTNIECIWTISCHFLKPKKHYSYQATNCRLKPTFKFPGHCTITLTTKNKVSFIRFPKSWNVFIEHPIRHLEIFMPKFAKPGSSIAVEVFIPNIHHDVTNVKISNEDAFYNAKASVRGSMIVYKSKVDLPKKIGLQCLRIRAHNNVSQVVERRHVMIVAEVGQIEIQSAGCLCVGKPAVFLVQIDGKIPAENKHYLYKWKFEINHVTSTAFTSVPIAQSGVLTQSGNLTVTAFVSNLVSEKKASLSVQVPENIIHTCLQHNLASELGSTLNISVLGLPDSCKNKNVSLNLLVKKNRYSFHFKPQKIKDAPDEARWRYVPQSPGFHSIMAQVSLEEDPNFISTNLYFHSGFNVEQRISSVELSGPRNLPITGISQYHEWRAKVTPSSSGCIFIWSLPDLESISTHDKLTTNHIPSPGTHQLRVRVRNSLGHLDASMVVQVALALALLNYTFSTFFVGHTGTLNITFNQDVAQGDIFVDFGDGVAVSWKQHPSVFKFYENKDGNGTSTVEVSHTYHTGGLHTVHFNASNSISRIERWTAVLVATPISGVKLELLTRQIVPLFEEVLVQCSVEDGGTGVGFEWDFGDGTDGQYTTVNSTNNSSLANHSYGVADTYNVTVRICNDYESITSHLNVSIRAVEPIEKLHLRPRMEQYAAPLMDRISTAPLLDKKSASPFLDKKYTDPVSDEKSSAPLLNKKSIASLDSSNGSYATESIAFEAWVWRGSDINFVFDFGDGHTAVVPSELNVWSLPCATVKHTYFYEGAYQVSVTATNPLDSVNQTLPQPFFVQFPPENLVLDRQYYIIQYKMNLSVHAAITRGTDVSYNWMLGNEQLPDTGSSVFLPILEPGIHIVSVEAYNKVTDFGYKSIRRPMASSKIYVQETLQEIYLCLVYDAKKNCHYNEVELPLDTEFKFVAEVLPASERSLRFTWQLGIPDLRRSNTPVMQYQYQNPGRYMINVTAQNHISSVSSQPLVLHLIQKIANLTSIHCQGPNLVNQLITFRALYWFESVNIGYQ
ncbi:hypothetical protein JTE90_022923, partial [Oedothorax gibbosus]